MGESNIGKVFLVGLVALAIGWILEWLIASYNTALLVDPITTTYYGISVLGWLGIVIVISLIIAAIVAFKVKPKKGKKGGGSGFIIGAIIGFLGGMFIAWILAVYYPATLIVI
jgi:hypothetical protein